MVVLSGSNDDAGGKKLSCWLGGERRRDRERETRDGENKHTEDPFARRYIKQH